MSKTYAAWEETYERSVKHFKAEFLALSEQVKDPRGDNFKEFARVLSTCVKRYEGKADEKSKALYEFFTVLFRAAVWAAAEREQRGWEIEALAAWVPGSAAVN